MIKEAIHTLLQGSSLPYDTAKKTMLEIMNGEATPAQIGGFLTALRLKGESIEEITAFAEAMRETCLRLDPESPVFEIVGTGGDEANTFNISTTAGFVIAAAGQAVAKHGNRSVSSKCGAADCLEALGAKLELTAEQNQEMLRQTGMCFMFAPVYHSSMRHAAPVRRELGVRTVFNILGPLANPAGASLQLMGVYDEALVEPLAKVLMNLGVTRGAVVHGLDGLDEITACAKTKVCEIKDGQLETYYLDPEAYGLTYAKPQDLVGGDKYENARITENILNGTDRGAKRTAVLLNAGMSLYLAGQAPTLAAGIALAEEIIDSGRALKQLEKFIYYSHQVA